MSLKEARATFTLKEDAALDPAALRTAVKKAGFTPRELTMTAEGRFLRVDGVLAFKVDGSGQLFRLEENTELTRLKNDSGLEEKVLTLTGKVIGDALPLTLHLLSQDMQPMTMQGK